MSRNKNEKVFFSKFEHTLFLSEFPKNLERFSIVYDQKMKAKFCSDNFLMDSAIKFFNVINFEIKFFISCIEHNT